jgi:hypothetical protein
MVYFECIICIKTLKKKQAERHNFECRSSCSFTCLTCWKVFDLETIKAHTSCVSEEEKYQKGDNMKKPGMKLQNGNKLEIKAVDINQLKWSGFRKTSKKILMGFENYKLSMNDLIQKLCLVYSKNKNVEVEAVDQGLAKKHLLEKLEKDSKFVIDLSKNTIRYKSL